MANCGIHIILSTIDLTVSHHKYPLEIVNYINTIILMGQCNTDRHPEYMSFSHQFDKNRQDIYHAEHWYWRWHNHCLIICRFSLTHWGRVMHTVETLYNTINFCWSTHKRHSIARPKGQGMGCLLWVQRATYCVDLSLLSSMKYLL